MVADVLLQSYKIVDFHHETRKIYHNSQSQILTTTTMIFQIFKKIILVISLKPGRPFKKKSVWEKDSEVLK